MDGKGTPEITHRWIWTCKKDSLEYFNPDPAQTDEEQQQNERLQRNRQDIMQAEGLVSLLLKLIDKAGFRISTQKYDPWNMILWDLFENYWKITIYTATQNIQYLHKDQVKPLEELLVNVYKLLAGIIRSNRNNCAKFSKESFQR